jgi:hypothetical protein
MSPAGQALGLGNSLQDQVDEETRRRKLQQQQQAQYSPATMSLLAGMGFR